MGIEVIYLKIRNEFSFASTISCPIFAVILFKGILSSSTVAIGVMVS